MLNYKGCDRALMRGGATSIHKGGQLRVKSSNITYFIQSCPPFVKFLADSIKTSFLARVSQGEWHSALIVLSALACNCLKLLE